MAAPIYYYAEMVRSLPEDGKRYETVHGELLVTPAPRLWHQVVLGRLYFGIAQYLAENRVGQLLSSPADISWDLDILVQPDLFVVELHEARTLDWAQLKTLLLVIEVLSPGTTRYDRFTKRRLCQEVGIPAYWIVDPEAKAVEVWAPTSQFPKVERSRVEWLPEGAPEPFTVELEELFAPI
jgi:Uma2 family endonuclease